MAGMTALVWLGLRGGCNVAVSRDETEEGRSPNADSFIFKGDEYRIIRKKGFVEIHVFIGSKAVGFACVDRVREHTGDIGIGQGTWNTYLPMED